MSIKTNVNTTSNQSFCPPPLRNGSMQTTLPVTLPYGMQQGSYCGVVASSNRDDGFFSGESNYVDGLIYTGFRYQCVEYARRFLLHTTGCIFESCGRASAIFYMDHITDVETGNTYPLIKHENGKSSSPPLPGDIIIYAFHPELVPFGHVGIISYVDDTHVGIIEQNMVFGSFTSPHSDDPNAERCISRMLNLRVNSETQTYTIEEIPPNPECLGWLSYPTAPRREVRFKPFRPLPQHIAIRSTPLNHPKHPSISVYTLPEGIDIATGKVQKIYGCKHGAGEELCGSTAAAIRVIRTTLQLLFDRRALCKDFLRLPANPLHAPLSTPCSHELHSLFEALNTVHETRDHESNEQLYEWLLPHVAAYFNIPVEWCEAMQRSFSRGELHLSAMLSYTYNVAPLSDRLAVFGYNSNSSISNNNNNEETEPHESYIERLPAVCQHDESWNFALADFNTPRILTELDHFSRISSQLRTSLDLLDPRYRCWMAYKFRWDFTGYLKAVETSCGPRTAFTMVLCPNMDGLERDLISLLQGYCERAKYPVRVIAEKDLHYDDESATLYAVPTTGSSSSAEVEWVSSPNTFSPSGMHEVNFVYSLAEWHDILHQPIKHEALFKAAMDKRSDVIFAKPLWGYLCSGVMNFTDDVNNNNNNSNSNIRTNTCDNNSNTTEHNIVGKAHTSINRSGKVPFSDTSLSIKFFNIARRLYELALPKQSPENWHRDISEFKDSCRRIHLTSLVPTKSEANVMVTAATINFALSAITAHNDVEIYPITNTTTATANDCAQKEEMYESEMATKAIEPVLLINASHGQPACYAHMFEPDKEKDKDDSDEDDASSTNSIKSAKTVKHNATTITTTTTTTTAADDEKKNNSSDTNKEADAEQMDGHDRCEHASREKEELQGMESQRKRMEEIFTQIL